MTKASLAQSLLDAGRIAEARETIAEAIKARDDLPDIYLLRARIEMAAGSAGTAYVAFTNALALDATNGEALMGVAQLGMRGGYLQESEDATDRILALDPKQPNALLIKGLLNFNKHRYADAMGNADAILSVTPSDEAGIILKTRTLAMMNKRPEALALAEDARGKLGDTRSIAVTLLELYRQQGNGPAMITQLEQLRKMSPDEHGLAIDEADTLYKLGDTPRARAILRGLILHPKLDENAAITTTRLWREYDPTPIDAATLDQISTKGALPARMAMARYYLDLGNPAQAEAALRLAPNEDDVVALRARIGVAQGKLDDSFAKASAILDKDETHCDALLARAEVQFARRQAKAAIITSQMAIASCPQLVPAYLVLARAQEMDGSQDGANIAYRDGVNRNDQDPGMARAYATWLERAGQGRRAVATARRLTNTAPAMLSGWTLYQELCARSPEAQCTPEATAGLAAARQRFGIDPRTGEKQPPGLFGRLIRA